MLRNTIHRKTPHMYSENTSNCNSPFGLITRIYPFDSGRGSSISITDHVYPKFGAPRFRYIFW